MPNTEELIRRYGPSFCVLPWKHLHLCDTGACKICCATSALRDQFVVVAFLDLLTLLQHDDAVGIADG